MLEVKVVKAEAPCPAREARGTELSAHWELYMMMRAEGTWQSPKGPELWWDCDAYLTLGPWIWHCRTSGVVQDLDAHLLCGLPSPCQLQPLRGPHPIP